jgi:Domain of unknown function (DUF4845)
MRRLKQQDGMAMIGWILLIGLIITISVLALKILPMYRYSFQILFALRDLKADQTLQIKKATPEEIKKILFTEFDYKSLKEITTDEITVSQGDNAYNVRIRHQLKEQVVGNWYIVLIIDESVDIPTQKYSQ